MRTLDEQWIENGRMYKAVKEQGEECVGCCHDTPTGCCTAPSMQGGKYECPVDRGLMVIDLGPVNEDVVLAEERTLRDWFAGQALFGLMAMYPLSDIQVAKRSFEYADAMLKERNK